jgi:hypothetical protein
MMDLTANGQVLTGTWTEETNPAGYYKGAVYHGAIQLLLEPTGRKMTGKWVGFGRDFDLNTGPWTLDPGTRYRYRHRRDPQGVQQASRQRMSWRRCRLTAEASNIRAGDVVLAFCRLVPPAGAANPVPSAGGG